MAEALIRINNQLEKSKKSKLADKMRELDRKEKELNQKELMLNKKEEAFKLIEEKLKKKILSNGMLMPFIGLGTSRIGLTSEKKVEQIIYSAKI